MKKIFLNVFRSLIISGFVINVFSTGVDGQGIDNSNRPADDSKMPSIESLSYPIDDLQEAEPVEWVLKSNTTTSRVELARAIPGERKLSGVTKLIGVPVGELDQLPEFNNELNPVPGKLSGVDSRSDLVGRAIATMTHEDYYFYSTATFPSHAEITNVVYTIRIDDNGTDAFFPYDYEIWLSSASHGDVEWYYQNVYNHLPNNIFATTDGGFDDDAEDDSDIYLSSRSSSAFNGEDPDQFFAVRISDTYGTSGAGEISYVYLDIYWEAPDPNLTYYTPDGWDRPLVISDVTGTVTDVSGFYTGRTHYIDFAFRNDDQDITDAFSSELWIDGNMEFSGTYSAGVPEGNFMPVNDRAFVFTEGEHTICSWVDPGGAVLESNEMDNVYCRTITVYGPPDAPILESPSNTATCQSTVVGFDWDDPAGAVSYRLVIDDDPSWGSRELDLSGIGGSNYTFSGLSQNTVYYWCVNATNPAGTSAWSDVYRFRTTPSAPETPVLSSPSNEESCVAVDLTLDWNPSTGSASYAVQVDDDSDFSSPIVNQSGLLSTYDLSGLAEGETYYWRAAGVNSCGIYSTWSSVRSFSTLWHAGPPTLAGPADDATCQGTTLDLTWSAASGAISYHVWVDDNDDFSSPEIDVAEVAGTTYEISGLSNGTSYYWAVASYNECEVTGDWPVRRRFTTAMPEPGTVSQNSPSGGAQCQPLSIDLSWDAATNANRYQLQLADNQVFDSPLYDEDDLSATSQTIGGLDGGTHYFWRVRAINGCGNQGSWSSIRDFTTIINSLSTPALSSPADAADCQPTTVTLSWGAVGDADEYELQIDDNSDFSSPAIQESVAGTSFNGTGLTETTEYFWRVKAVGICSVESDWSALRSFETGSNGIDAPALSSPVNMSSDQALTVNLSWAAVTDASSYQVQLDDNDDFSSPLLDETQSGANIEAADLDEGTNYYWHVMASAECASSDWSDTWEFETETEEVSIEVKEGLGYNLKQNVPNPFLESSLVEFSIAVDCDVTFQLIDIQGRLIQTTTEFYQAGTHTFTIEADDLQQAGVYIYRMKTDGFTDTGVCVAQ